MHSGGNFPDFCFSSVPLQHSWGRSKINDHSLYEVVLNVGFGTVCKLKIVKHHTACVIYTLFISNSPSEQCEIFYYLFKFDLQKANSKNVEMKWSGKNSFQKQKTIYIWLLTKKPTTSFFTNIIQLHLIAFITRGKHEMFKWNGFVPQQCNNGYRLWSSGTITFST